MFPVIKSLLMADPEVSSLVANRIFPDEVPQGQLLPAISMFVVSTRYQKLADGTQLATASNWQINCINTTRMDASQLADAVVKAIDNQSGNGIKNTLVINRSDELPAAGVRLRRTIIDVEIKHY